MIKTQRVIVLVDTSYSMENAISDVKKSLKTLNRILIHYNNKNVRVLLQIIQFSEKAKFISRNRIDTINADGRTNLGDSYEKLNLIFKNNKNFDYPPLIFLLCDGCPSFDYKEQLNKLYKYVWFRKSLRIAMSYQTKDTNSQEVLGDFTGNLQNVFQGFSINYIKTVLTKSLPKIIQERQKLKTKSKHKVLVKILADDIKFLSKRNRLYAR